MQVAAVTRARRQYYRTRQFPMRLPRQLPPFIPIIQTPIISCPEQELGDDMESLPWKQWQNTHAKVDGFRHKRDQQLAIGQTQ